MLTEVHLPNEAEEAVRDLCRLRQSAHKDLLRTQHQLSKILLRRGFLYKLGSKCHKRLYKGTWHLLYQGKLPNKVTVAVARELVGFIWAIWHILEEIAPEP